MNYDARRAAVDFSRVLREWLTDDEMLEVIARNKVRVYAGVCHSHDFCDANEAMLQAWAMQGVEVDPQDDDHITHWNQAWGIAQQGEFDPDRIEGDK